MGKIINLIDQRFGFWIVIAVAPKGKSNQTQWLCKCECNLEKIISSNSLRTGNSTSCGCNHVPNLINEKFDKLTVISQSKYKKDRRYWDCLCNCGNTIIVSTYNLRNKNIISCKNCKSKI